MERFEVVAEIEALCASLACRRSARQQHRRDRARHAGLRGSGGRLDLDAYCSENIEFHRAIHAALGQRVPRHRGSAAAMTDHFETAISVLIRAGAT
ncbi:FCD domain-containing protein [Salipiger mangrovisoli]|uniref:FCD domain-containing protein n=1 Tax=Salipiger mangrovisoli TaxID=2865933 RepID=A0ABR9X5F9_9RHOB|nr:FCD domain-containing protein [Salipiger mangrovisoli]MBE9638809.1 FCD domain-containing protein [Salipiger mangrovisoli]